MGKLREWAVLRGDPERDEELIDIVFYIASMNQDEVLRACNEHDGMGADYVREIIPNEFW